MAAKGASAMQQLAERLEWVGNSLSEFRQEAKERFDRMDERLQEHGERLARLETDVAVLKSKSSGNGVMKWLYYIVSALVGGLVALGGGEDCGVADKGQDCAWAFQTARKGVLFILKGGIP